LSSPGIHLKNKIMDSRTAQEIIDQEVVLTVPMLAKIWGINKTNAWRRLTNQRGLYYRWAFKDEGQWYIRKVDFMRVIAQARGKSEVIKEQVKA